LLAECQNFGISRLATYYSLMASRIATLRNAPPPPDWDGVFALMEK
jgi:hypothetical protein